MTILRFRMASTVGSRAGASYRPGRNAHAKNFTAKIPRNSLISLDSDERIQGNPRKSNPQKRGFSRQKGREPRKSKRTCRTTIATTAEGARPTPSDCKAL